MPVRGPGLGVEGLGEGGDPEGVYRLGGGGQPLVGLVGGYGGEARCGVAGQGATSCASQHAAVHHVSPWRVIVSAGWMRCPQSARSSGSGWRERSACAAAKSAC